jgi:hypothetical protein
MEHLIAEEVAGIAAFFTVTVNAHTSAIKGVVIRSTRHPVDARWRLRRPADRSMGVDSVASRSRSKQR